MHWLVIGFGNALAGDDGFGIAVAEEIEKRLALDLAENEITIEVIARRILAPELIENITTADGVIFIDASADVTDGKLQRINLQQTDMPQNSADSKLDCGSSSMLMSHHCNPVTLMQLSHTLYDRKPPAWLYAVGAFDFSLSENLSGELAALVPKVADQIIDQIRKHAIFEKA